MKVVRVHGLLCGCQPSSILIYMGGLHQIFDIDTIKAVLAFLCILTVWLGSLQGNLAKILRRTFRAISGFYSLSLW